ncbi:hypothetical protein M378DRAFT_157054, partial [Amanita muscaria Koide BX008]
DYLAFVPPPANISIGFGALLTKLNNDIEQLKKEHEQKMSVFEQKMSVSEQKHLEHERALVDLRAQQADTLSWITIGDDGILDQIMLRNLLDKAQTVVANACGLRTDNQEPSSWNWRSQFIGIKPEDRPAIATSLLQGSSLDKSIIHQLCASQHALWILSEKTEIRKEGDKLAHDELINMQRYTVGIDIERQSRSDSEKSKALKLLLEVVKGYK